MEVEIKDKDEYIHWLETICLTLLTKEEKLSVDDIVGKLSGMNVSVDNQFINKLISIYNKNQEENDIIKRLPLLKDYPIGLYDDISMEDEEPLYMWELKTVKLLLSELYDKHKGKHITLDVYEKFFEEEIKPYADGQFILNDCDLDGCIIDKLSPENMCLYWSYRIDKRISWNESLDRKNVAISIISVLEGDYLIKNKQMGEFSHYIGNDASN